MRSSSIRVISGHKHSVFQMPPYGCATLRIMHMPKAILFDLDETLAPSFEPISDHMGSLLSALTGHTTVAIVSGAGFDRIERGVCARMGSDSEKLLVFSNSGSQCHEHRSGTWDLIYSNMLSIDERTRIREVIEKNLSEHPDLVGTNALGAQILDRETQMAFVAVGIDSPREVKASWDPTGEKRQRIARDMQHDLPDCDILIAGAATIDVTRKGMNKSYAVHWLAEYMNINPETMLFVGDALYPGGNDEVVIPTGIQTHRVADPSETEKLIQELLDESSAKLQR
jgi:phosphomannomutase